MKIEIKINNKKIKTESGKTVLEVALENKIDIPALCYHPDLKIKGSCRLCLIQVKGKKNLTTSCSTKVVSGMEVLTETSEIERARKINLELLFSQHREECFDCVWDSNCELLRLAKKYNVEINRFKDRKTKYPVYRFGNALEFDSSKCIDCGNCVEVCHNQGVDFLETKERGHLFQVVPSKKKDKDCIYCGQCVTHCPAGAFEAVGEYEGIEESLNKKDKVVVFQFAPSIRTIIKEGQIVAGLKKLGVDKVFDTCVGADFTTTSEAEEVVERIKSGKNLPILTSCCPSWVKYVEQNYPEFIPNLSTTRSPQVILGGLIKTYWAEKEGIDPKKIFVVSIMPCVSKKFEIERPQLKISGMKAVDYVLTTREFQRLLKRHNIDLETLKPEKTDLGFGDPSGAGIIYGASGGVMESAFRTAYEKLTNEKLKDVEFKQVRGMKGVKEVEIKIKGEKKKIAVINGLGNAKKLIDDIKSGKRGGYTCIEVMACPGGCIGGGGQPLPTSEEIRSQRASSLYQRDKKEKIRKAHENPIVKKVYEKLAHEVLHTSYNKKGKGTVKKI